MSDHRHPLCVVPSGLVITTSDTTTIDRLRAQLADRDQRISALEAQVDELMCWTVGEFVDGELDAERAAAFRLHLAKCANCTAEVESLAQMATRLSTIMSSGERRDG